MAIPHRPLAADDLGQRDVQPRLEAFEDAEALSELGRWIGMDTGGHELVIAGLSDLLGKNELLCTGKVGECPTDPRLKRQHQCDGILGRFAGHDLFWIGCTTFALPTREEAAALDDFDLDETHAAIAAARSSPVAIWGANPDDLIASAKTYIQGMGDEGEPAFVIKLLSPRFGWDLTEEQRATLLSDEYLSDIVARHRGAFGL